MAVELRFGQMVLLWYVSFVWCGVVCFGVCVGRLVGGVEKVARAEEGKVGGAC